jgi:hypothetical protein
LACSRFIGQIGDLIDDQRSAGVDSAMHGLSVTALMLGHF